MSIHILICLFVAPPDHEEEYQYSGSEEEDEQLLAGMIAEEMGSELCLHEYSLHYFKVKVKICVQA